MTPKQRQYGDLLMGAETDIKIVSEEGLEGNTVRDGDRTLPREDGSIPGLHLAESKTVVLDLLVKGDTVDATTAEVLAAFQPSRRVQSQYRFVNLSGVESFVWARPLRVGISRTNTTEHSNHRPVKVALKAADPRVYSVEQHQSDVPLFGNSGGGAEFPNVWPHAMTASEQELGVAINDGSRDAYPRITFQHDSGTVSGVELENLTNGDVVDVDTTISSGQQLVADMDALIRATGSAVVAIGESSRYGDWQPPRDPFRLSPGSNSLRLTVDGGGSVVCVVQWRTTD